MVLGRSIPLSLATGNGRIQPLPRRPREQRNPADIHRPVLVDEIVEYLASVPSGRLIDATVGMGGHADALLRSRPDQRLVGIDRDADALEMADLRLSRWSDRYELSHADYRRLPDLVQDRGWAPVSAVVADLGISSLQLDTDERGFSFMREGPLDMRMDRRQQRTAADLVNRLSYTDLRSLIRDFGEERHASRVARAIVRARDLGPLVSTTQLAKVVSDALPHRGGQRLHPATRTFQALRIAVNDELGGLYEFVLATARLLIPGGRLAVVSFHSLEDRQVKRAYRYLASDCECPPGLPQCACTKRAEVRVLTRRPIGADAAEVATNPRARSARLRVLERI